LLTVVQLSSNDKTLYYQLARDPKVIRIVDIITYLSPFLNEKIEINASALVHKLISKEKAFLRAASELPMNESLDELVHLEESTK
jgi:hypothetical protein